ncbi:MAG: hypothetical protein EOM24_13615, partial [Chloroflexia bacterium]|nr:hypothetical protein [Chloroflexia bacterium]
VPQYPAAEGVRGLLAVAAMNQAGHLATFSTRGPWVAISAPGEQIISTVPGNNYATWSGTSMAAPLVAGTAALIRAQQPTLTPGAIANQLISTTQPLCSAGPARLDAARALGAPTATAFTCRIYFPLAQKR